MTSRPRLHFVTVLLLPLLWACGEELPSESFSPSSGGSAGLGDDTATGGSFETDATWDTARGVAPYECEEDAYEVLVNTQLDSRFALIGDSLFLQFPTGSGASSLTSVDEIRLEPWGRRRIWAGDGYSDAVVAVGGALSWGLRPEIVRYLEDDFAAYHVESYDPATEEVSLLVESFGDRPVASPLGPIVKTAGDTPLTLYPSDGSPPEAICDPGGSGEARANATQVLVGLFSRMTSCQFEDGAREDFVPFEGYDGTALADFVLDDSFAYLLHNGSGDTELNGVRSVALDTKQSAVLAQGEYTHVRVSGRELWLSDGEGRIYRLPVDGTLAPELVVEQSSVLQFELDDDFLYWTRFTSLAVGCVKRMPRPAPFALPI